MTYSQSYYDDIRGRLRAVLFTVADVLPEDTLHFVAEELDANELGLSLETLVDVLEEISAHVSRETVSELAALNDVMRIGINVRERLGPGIPGGEAP